MKAIEVRDQVSLPLRRCLQLTLRGVRHRLFRSVVTVVIVVLAVAFLMMMLSTSFVDRQVSQDVRRRTAGRRMLAEWVDKLSVPMTPAALVERLAAAERGSPVWQELAGWSGLNEEALTRLSALAGQQVRYERYLAAIEPGERSALVGSREGEAVFTHLAEPANLDEFVENVKSVRMSFPTGKEELTGFVAAFVETAPLREKILTGHAAAVAALEKDLGATSVLALLAGGPTGETLRRHGFAGAPQVFEALRQEALLALDAERLAALLTNKRMRGVIAKRLAVDVPKLVHVHVLRIASARKGAAWLKQEVEQTRREVLRQPPEKREELIESLDASAERIAEVASGRLKMDRLAEVEASLPEEGGGGWLGFSSRTAWLILISFVVCVVGVANAMLMSVTERFREIATMKCLGALDSVIMVMFVMESSLQGLAGGLVGVVLGLLLGVVRSLWGFGTLALVNLPGLVLLASAGVCLVAGVVLAALAAVYPAWVAARLAPMEAMRIE